MPPDLEPASAIAVARKVLNACAYLDKDRLLLRNYEVGAALIEADRAAVREPLERRIAELEEQAEDDRRDFAEAAALDFPGGKPTREDLIEGLQGLVESHDAHVERIADLEVRAEKLGALVDSGADAMFSAADQRIGELEATVRQFVVAEKRFNDRIASLEAQLASAVQTIAELTTERESAREEALREVLRDLQQFADSFLAEARKAELSGRYDQFSEHARSRVLVQTCAQRVRKLLPPPAAQKEPHGR